MTDTVRELQCQHALSQLKDLERLTEDLAWALFTVLDGEPDHHFQERFALDDEDGERLTRARHQAGHYLAVTERLRQMKGES